MPQNNTWLIIAQSGRALAVSAAKAGMNTLVIDGFADTDTVAVADHVRVAALGKSGFDASQLLEILAGYAHSPIAGVVTGSGLENQTEVLEFICRHWPLMGNDAGTVRACKDPDFFFGLLDRLQIPHPAILHDQAPLPGEWLLKESGGTGGRHISCYCPGDQIPADCYVQERVRGRALSVVFLANGNESRIVGINEIHAVAPERGDFRYRGAISLPEIEPVTGAALMEMTASLAAELRLHGLCGMDVIADAAGRCQVLEINPRPTATFELHERNNSLFEAHLKACDGEVAEPERTSTSRAHRVVYAEESFRLPEFPWPEWTTDRPRPGKTVAAGEPVCMIHAEAMDREPVIELIESRTRILERLIDIERLAA